MYRERSVAVVVPAHNEETQIAGVAETMPECVDAVFVVDDASTDGTRDVVSGLASESGGRVRLIGLDENLGVGGAIEAGYRAAYDDGFDIVVVMAGDGQMDPADLPNLLDPVAADEVDYAKGNRLIVGESWKLIPWKRFAGNAVLSFLTKIASGYWHVADSQTGYTAVNRRALEAVLREGIYRSYGMPNDVLVKLNVHDMRVRDVPVRPVYDVGEVSKLKIHKVVCPIAWLLVKLFFFRMWRKYCVRDTHPLVLFYLAGLLLAPFGAALGAVIVLTRLVLPHLLSPYSGFLETLRTVSTDAFLLTAVLCLLMGMQMLLFAMWFDMADNQRLR